MQVVYGKEDNIWYVLFSFGNNEVRKQISKTAQNIGLQGRLASHSVHKTCISRLLNSDFPVNYFLAHRGKA